MTDAILLHDLSQKAEETRRLEVVHIGIPEVLGFDRESGEPVWGIGGAADTNNFRDTRVDPITTDEGNVTLATTQKALWPYARTLLPANYFNRIGKTVKLTAWGKTTTDGTAGNYVAGVGYGSSDAPTALGAGAAVAGTTSQSNISWRFEAYATCRLIGATGTLMAFGQWMPAVAVLASTLQPYIIPSSAAVATTVDTTVGTNSLVCTLQRSSTGVWTIATQALIFEALN